MLKYVISAFCMLSTLTFAAVEKINLKDRDLPANDLVHPMLGDISAEKARRLQREGLDLSKLGPKDSAVWKNYSTNDAQIEIEEATISDFGSMLEFKGSMTSQENTFFFSAINSRSKTSHVVMMDISLHSNLLRKSLLRKLGYIVPSMKYVPTLTVRFSNIEEVDNFLNVMIPHNTSGHADRWVVEYKKESNSLELKIRDVIVMSPQEKDHLNLALNVPPRRLGPRVQRVMSLLYALTNVKESVNKLSWRIGNVSNNKVNLNHHGISNMGTTKSDALWVLEKIAKFDRLDFEEIVAAANYPQSVSVLLIEKLISRRNHLNELFSYDASEIEYNTQISFGSDLKNGQLVEKDWKGFASRFSYGEPDSPFKDLHLYAYSEIKSELIDNLVSIANEKLKLIDINDKKYDYFKKDFQKGLEHYIETGEFLEKEVGTWVSPTVDGSLILSRKTVIGNSGSNDNLIQLADTIGYSVALGAHLGVEGLETGWGLSAKAKLHYVKTYTHLKPITSLKEAIKEDHKNMIIPFFKYSLSKKLDRLEDVVIPKVTTQKENDNSREDATSEIPTEQSQVSTIIDLVSKQMGVGESLVITSRITPQVLANVGYSVSGTSQSINTTAKAYFSKKWHIYKKNADEYQIYLDKGRGVEWSISYSLRHKIPILRASYKTHSGKYDVEMYTLNLNQKLSKNKDLYKNAIALSSLIKNGSKELVRKNNVATLVSNDFYDQSSKFSFLVWKKKHLEQEDEFFIKDKKGRETEIIRHSSKDLFGLNYRNFITEIANYYIVKNWDNISLSSNPWKHPGKSVGGRAKVAVYNYEAIKKDNKLYSPFLSITELQEGWSIKKKKLKKKLKDLNKRYSGNLFNLFSSQDVADATDLKLYKIKVSMNIYAKGVHRLRQHNSSIFKSIEKKYYRNRRKALCDNKRHLSSSREVSCGNFRVLFSKRRSCNKDFEKKDFNDASECMAEYAKKLKKYLKLDDFIELVGKDNYYIYGSVDGFRKDSEILNDTIHSNSHGLLDRTFGQGPVEFAKQKLGMQSAEFFGSWLREAL